MRPGRAEQHSFRHHDSAAHGFLNLDEIKSIVIRRGEEQKFAFATGDFVITEGGDADKLGRAAMWAGQLAYCAHQDHVFPVRPRAVVVLSDYLRDLVGSAYGKAYFLSVAKRTTGIASTNKTQLGNFPVPHFRRSNSNLDTLPW